MYVRVHCTTVAVGVRYSSVDMYQVYTKVISYS